MSQHICQASCHAGLQKSNHQPPRSGLADWLTNWLCCGELLHSELVATADLLRRVHAHWPSTQATQPHLAWRLGGYTVNSDNMQNNKLNACSGTRQRFGCLGVVEKGRNRRGRSVVRPLDFWILLPRVFCCQSLIQRRAGCGYKKSSTFGGGGNDNERNPIASKPSMKKRWRRWLEINERRVKYVWVWSLLFSFCLSPQHLYRSLRIRDVTSLCDDHQPSCARGPDSIAPRNKLGRAHRGL